MFQDLLHFDEGIGEAVDATVAVVLSLELEVPANVSVLSVDLVQSLAEPAELDVVTFPILEDD